MAQHIDLKSREMSNSLISVIVPVYNSSGYLHSCIDSIINQDYQNIEIILVDDGSTDNSLAICKEYAQECRNIKVIHIENSGVSNARNIGIDAAEGFWITFIDSDDRIEKNYLSSFNMSNIQVELYVQGYKIFEGEKYIGKRCFPKSKIIDEYEAFIELESVDIINSPVCKLFRNDIIKKHNIRFDPNISYGEDHLFCLEYLNYCKRIFNSSNTGYHYIHQNIKSLTTKLVPIDSIYYYVKRFDELARRFYCKNRSKEYFSRINERSYSTIKRMINNSVVTRNPTYLKQSVSLRKFIDTRYLRLNQKALMLMFKYTPVIITYNILKILEVFKYHLYHKATNA